MGLWGHSMEAQLVLILIVLLFLATILLLIPLQVSFLFLIDDGHSFLVKVSWFFGLIKTEMKKGIETENSWKISEEEKKTEEDKKKEKRKKRSKRKIPARDILEILRDREFRERILVSIRDLAGALEFKDFRARFRFGLDDPSETGALYGYLFGILALFPADAMLEPTFDQEVLEGDARGSVLFLPYRVVLAMIRFLASVKTLKTMLWLAKSFWRGS